MSFEKFFLPSLHLETGKVLLRPMEREDFDKFFSITRSAVLWKYFSKILSDQNELKEWMEQALFERSDKRRFPFTIIDKSNKAVCGSTSFGNISFYDKRIEIGWTWLGEQFLGSGINQHCKYALLRYAFEVLLFERVEIKTDNLNERAKKALRKIGATEEGVLRSHMQMPGNRRRDSVYFSILKNEWPRVKEAFFSGIN